MTDQNVVPCQAPLCGRPLKSRASRLRGYGPVCYDRLFPAVKVHRLRVEKASTNRGRDHSQHPDLLDELEPDQ